MKVHHFLALRFLSGRRRGALISFLTFMAWAGVLLSVASWIVVEAVMLGFNQDLQRKIIGFSPHIVLSSAHPLSSEIEVALAADREVQATLRFHEGEAILRTEDELRGVKVRGFDLPRGMPAVTQIQFFFEEGEGWEHLHGAHERLPGILLGNELASALGVIPVFSEPVELLYPFGDVGPTGEVEPSVRRFRVIGTFKSGYYEYDHQFAMIALEESQRLFAGQFSEQLGIFLHHPERAGLLRDRFLALSQAGRARSWEEMNRRLFSALRLERLGMGLVLGLMLLLSSFNILSMLMLMVFERRREIAVLQALGLSVQRISAVFYQAGLWIGVCGALGGLGLGVGLCAALAWFKIRLPAPYYLDALPVELRASRLVIAFAAAVLLSLLATILPGLESRRETIVAALRRE